MSRNACTHIQKRLLLIHGVQTTARNDTCPRQNCVQHSAAQGPSPPPPTPKTTTNQPHTRTERHTDTAGGGFAGLGTKEMMQPYLIYLHESSSLRPRAGLLGCWARPWPG